MANEENLISLGDRSEEDKKRIASMGGKARQEKQKRVKTMQSQIELLLSLPLKDEKAKAKMASLGIDVDNIDNSMAMMIAVYQKAIKGDMSAVTFLRDTGGQKPIDKIEADVTNNNTELNDILEQLKK